MNATPSDPQSPGARTTEARLARVESWAAPGGNPIIRRKTPEATASRTADIMIAKAAGVALMAAGAAIALAALQRRLAPEIRTSAAVLPANVILVGLLCVCPPPRILGEPPL